MVAAVTLPKRVLAHGVSWKTYVLLREAIDEGSFKMTYFKGALELTTPSDRHELTKSVLVRMIDLYAFLARVALVPYGSTTYRNPLVERGLKLIERFLSRDDHDAALHEFAEHVRVGKKKKRR